MLFMILYVMFTCFWTVSTFSLPLQSTFFDPIFWPTLGSDLGGVPFLTQYFGRGLGQIWVEHLFWPNIFAEPWVRFRWGAFSDPIFWPNLGSYLHILHHLTQFFSLKLGLICAKHPILTQSPCQCFYTAPPHKHEKRAAIGCSFCNPSITRWSL